MFPPNPPLPSAMRNLISAADRSKSSSTNGLRLFADRKTGSSAIAPLLGFLYLPSAIENPRWVSTRVFSASSKMAHGITRSPINNSPECVAFGTSAFHRAATAFLACSLRCSFVSDNALAFPPIAPSSAALVFFSANFHSQNRAILYLPLRTVGLFYVPPRIRQYLPPRID